MANIVATDGPDFIHVAGDGNSPPSAIFTEFDTATNGSDVINTAGGSDIVFAGGGGDTLKGLGGNDILSGQAGDDSLDGGDLNDRLIGGAGADALSGGAGRDIIQFDGGTGVTVNLTTLQASGGEAQGDTLANDIEDIQGSAGGDALTGSVVANQLFGLNGNDTLLGLGEDDTLDGDAGSDRLEGGDGDDILRGGAGGDVLIGGAGIDTAQFGGGAAGVVVNLTANAVAGGDAAGDTISGIENVLGTGSADTLIGSAAANLLDGGGGNDILSGLAGNDTLRGNSFDDRLHGGAGADVLDGDSGIDTATYSDSVGGVAVNLATGIGSGAHAAGDTLQQIENVQGSAFADSLTGSSLDNVLRGGAGADVLVGGFGIDTAAYDEGGVGVVVDLAAGTGAGGNAQGDTLSGIENLTGGLGADRLTGSSAKNVLQGLSGNDILRGGNGGDTLDGGAGIDLATYFGSTTAVKVDLGNTSLESGGEAGGDRLIDIENVNGSTAGDTLTGNAVANALSGFEGNDLLKGAAGKDMLAGGLGADRFIYAATGDSVVGANADRIVDFSRAQGDRIDLAGIDANLSAIGNQSFSFIGSGLFTGAAGQLRFAVTAPGVTTVAGDVTGDGVSDFHITLAGQIGLQATDFVL
ncbi:Ca2+-binding RTX toxin-like protein [Inquilinus ginsengisoli]|uniref:calcium-binding protein n=1 Tax=Inquilinus ginsengisoli TaxID=363840 RepID=UPI003D218A75